MVPTTTRWSCPYARRRLRGEWLVPEAARFLAHDRCRIAQGDGEPEVPASDQGLAGTEPDGRGVPDE